MAATSDPAVLDAELVLDARAQLAEGPVWDTETEDLIWVDIMAGSVNRLRPDEGWSSRLDVGQPVGAVALRSGRGLVLALQEGFAVLDPGESTVRFIASVEAEIPGNRMNDGKCDPAGRFWAGTMAIDEGPPVGGLYRLDRDGSATRILSGVRISNGIGWSPDGGTMYYIDTPTGRIDAFDFDPGSGMPSRRRPFVELDSREGHLDGLTVDAEGCVWVALWGGRSVRRYSPDGTLVGLVRLPVSQVTSCTFGGEGLGDLYITSARRGLSAAQLEAEPHAGGLFRCRPGVRGLPAERYAG